MVAFYLERREGISPVNISDLRSIFARAREPLPSNLNDAVNKNIKKALMMEVSERKDGLKSWVVTSSGERMIETQSETTL
jgi:hypothetical protein